MLLTDFTPLTVITPHGSGVVDHTARTKIHVTVSGRIRTYYPRELSVPSAVVKLHSTTLRDPRPSAPKLTYRQRRAQQRSRGAVASGRIVLVS
jgi:hypothetical protein